MNELLLKTELAQRQRQFVEACRASGYQLTQLVNDILDLSKIEAGKMELELRACNLELLIGNVTDIMRHSARQKGIDLISRLAPEICTTVRCDEGRLRQVLVNLIGNAVKFTTLGSVTVCGDRVADPEGATRLRLTVSDTGIGIPEQRRDRLFTPFSQVDASTTRRYGGTGLGLSICRQLVELMGGEIGVESQVGVGSQFWLEIPVEAVDPVADTAEPNAGPAPDIVPRPVIDAAGGQDQPPSCDATPPALSGHILLAEDNRINQLFMVEMLRHLGCSCDLAVNGLEAVAAVERKPYDLILMDCQMPEMDGFTATGEIRLRQASGQISKHLPIVALTANALKGDRQRCLDAGMDDYVAKPIDSDQLMQTLQKYLQPGVADTQRK